MEIINFVKQLTGDKFDNDLAKRLNIDKQSLSQYKNKQRHDLQEKIISLLILQIQKSKK